MKAAIDLLAERVLNKQYVRSQIYNKMSVSAFVGQLGFTNLNLLVIGKQNSWLINARTGHSRHFVGTRLASGLTRQACDVSKWRKLELFVARYAAP